MREEEFRKFLMNGGNIKSKVKAVNSRLAKALRVERELNVNLDDIVKNDEAMYHLLLQIQEKLNDRLYHKSKCGAKILFICERKGVSKIKVILTRYKSQFARPLHKVTEGRRTLFE
ncbi:hypothetical protein ABS784_15980 [Geobacillus sp. G4]|uniref:hypothetical protein n=1 Tax=Geobacillus TaxID=129337 RepID=UPI000409AEAE|nr:MULTISPECIES: hypothetical protein [Geobacillus]WMJ19858.1 hypothetical protein RA957_17030 [Geobacillus kaustophilus]